MGGVGLNPKQGGDEAEQNPSPEQREGMVLGAYLEGNEAGGSGTGRGERRSGALSA